MRGRHHIYNFHIGFWGAFLVSLTLMFHSAVLLLASAGITAAQTAPFITINSPSASQTFQQGDIVSLSATTASPVTQLSFVITNQTSGVVVTKNADVDPTFTNFTSSILLTEAADYKIDAIAVNPQTGSQVTQSTTIVVLSGVVLDVIWRSPSANSTITGNQDLTVAVNPAPQSVLFRFTSQSGSVQEFQGNASQGDEWTHSLDSTVLPDGAYTIVGVASLNGEETSSTSIQVNVQNTTAIQGTFSLSNPDQGQIVSGTNVSFTGSSSSVASNVNFQITPGASSAQDIISAVNSSGDSISFQSSFDSTTYPNGDYSVILFGTINGETVFSDVVGFTINNQATGTPPVITTNTLPSAQLGIAYSQTISATGGTTPLVWSVTSGFALPPSLSINGNTGAITGIPTTVGSYNLSFTVTDSANRTATKTFSLIVNPAPTPPTSCGNGTLNTGEQCDDGNNVSGDGCSAICTNEAPVPPNAPASLTITQPAVNTSLQGSNSLVIMTGSEAIAEPTVLLVNTAGQNVLAGISTKAFKPVQHNGNSIWHYLLDTTKHLNGSYSLRMVTTAQDDGATLNAGPITVTINNPAPVEENVFTGGSIVRPTNGQSTSGIVLIQAQISGAIKSVTFNLQTAANGTKIVTGKFNQAKNLYEATWNTAGIQAGAVILKTNIVTEGGQQATLPNRTFNLVAETAPVIIQAPTPSTPLTEPRPEEIIPTQVLENVDSNGQVLQIAIECQVVGIKTEAECKEYLTTRSIRILDEGEQEAVAGQLNDIVSRHIEFNDGTSTERDFSKPGQAQKNLSQPLSEILPINPKLARQSNFLISPSTKPPANIRRFVEQTVDAVLVIDKDGDGLSDDAELRYGSDPNNPDSDDDGFTDGEEVKNGFNPNGPGLLSITTAPTDIAILNNRPLDQPRFAGVIAETITVDGVTSLDVLENESNLNIRGKAEPNSFVTLYIYSSLPVVVTVQANQSGDWEYDFTHPLVDGKHDVYATVTNDTGKIVKKSRALSFFVQEAKAVNEEDFLNANLTVQDDSNIFLAYYLVGGLLIVLLGGVMFFYYLRAQKGFS